MNKFKSVLFAVSACLGVLGMSQEAAAVCVSTAANNFCHADFNMNNFTSSTYKNTALGFNGTTGANANAPNSASATGMGYTLDSTGQAAISMTALKNVTNQITWTVTQGGTFAFDFLISGQSSLGAKSYLIINNGTPILLGTGTGPLNNVSGHYTTTLAVGQTVSFKHMGTTNNLLNSSQLQVSSFKGLPEINGGILPLGLLLLGLLFIAVKRKDAGDDGSNEAVA
jgi:hypothetical protein